MSLNRQELEQAIASHGPVVRVVIAEARGSTPREPGTAMLVWDAGQSGTIGGGALEYQATAAARALLAQAGAAPGVTRQALGPALNQCCGGAVTLVSEIFDARTLAALPDGPHARRVEGMAEMPLSLRRALRTARAQGGAPSVRLSEGWLIEPVTAPPGELWIFGAGHVGRALVQVLAPLPDLAITWVDTDSGRFPDPIPTGVTPLSATDPARLVPHIPPHADTLILTYSHMLDLSLCHALLRHPPRSIGLIGSATKWARFRSRLRQLGHPEAEIARIACPIGNPALGKHPQAIALGVAAAMLAARTTQSDADHDRSDHQTGTQTG